MERLYFRISSEWEQKNRGGGILGPSYFELVMIR